MKWLSVLMVLGAGWACAAGPIVIAHRGASGYRPEHTLAAYALAIEQGADYIEPDLCMTRDGVLVARHEPVLAAVSVNGKAEGADEYATTNVAELPQFADRRRTRLLDGVSIDGWWVDDFTLAELRTIKARERGATAGIRPGNVAFNDTQTIPTLREVIELAQARSAATGRVIGVYPETKHPTFHRDSARANGTPTMETALVAELHAAYGNDPAAPVFIQSFEVGNLRELAGMTNLRLVQLLGASGGPWDLNSDADPANDITYRQMAAADGLKAIALYADGIGANKALMIPRTADGRLGEPTRVVAEARALGLIVHGWTFRAENQYLPTDLRRGMQAGGAGDMVAEVRRFLELGMDGFFTDHPDLGVEAVRRQAQVKEEP